MGSFFRCAATVVLFAALVGCGSEDPKPPANPGDTELALLPFATGNRWTYRVTEGSEVTVKENVIGAEEPVSGTGVFKDEIAFKVTTHKQGGADQTISWQKRLGDRVVRYREQSFHADGGALELEESWSPPKLRVDESAAHTVSGASWYEDYEESKLEDDDSVADVEMKRDRWFVRAVGQELTVPAGTFQDVIVIEKTGIEALKTYYFARGIGKLKETGGQTEDLVSYELVP